MSQESRTEQESRIVDDATVLQRILHDMGVKSYEPEVIGELYGFMHNYACRILADAELVSKEANKNIIDVHDVRLATQIAEGDVKSPPSRNAIIRLAEQRNKIPLSGCRSRNRLRLPPHRKCLMGVNFVDVASKLPATATTTTTAAQQPPTMKALQPPAVKPLQEHVARSEKNIMKLVNVGNNYKFVRIGEESTKPPNETQLQQRMQPGMKASDLENLQVGVVKQHPFD